MGKLINKDDFAAIKSSDDIAQIAKPLELLGITYFNFIRVYKDQSRLSLANNSAWLKTFFDQAFYK